MKMGGQKMRPLMTIGTLLTCFYLSSMAFAVTLYVTPAGNDANSGRGYFERKALAETDIRHMTLRPKDSRYALQKEDIL
jgi:hypothetical protein